MKEVCGYKDKEGKFWDTKEEALKSNNKIDLGNIEAKIRNSSYDISHELFPYSSSTRSVRQSEIDHVIVRLFDHPEVFIEHMKLYAEYQAKVAELKGDSPVSLFEKVKLWLSL